MENLFDVWNEMKKKIAQEPLKKIFPKEGQVWMCLLGKNIGFEQDGSLENYSRPVLIVKKFNSKMFWCIPLSSHQKEFDFYKNFIDPNGKEASLILAQLRLLSPKRFFRYLYRFSETDLQKTKGYLKEFL